MSITVSKRKENKKWEYNFGNNCCCCRRRRHRCRSGSVSVSINEVNLRRARGWPCPGSIPGAKHLSRYVTSHPSQFSLVILSWVRAMSTSQRAVTPCGWGVKAGMVRVWVAGKSVWSSCYTRAISERFTDASWLSAIHTPVSKVFGVYIFLGEGGQWGGHNCSWGPQIYIATVNHP